MRRLQSHLEFSVRPALNTVVTADPLEQVHADIEVLGGLVPWEAVCLREVSKHEIVCSWEASRKWKA